MAVLSGIDWKTVLVTILLLMFAVPFVTKLISKA